MEFTLTVPKIIFMIGFFLSVILFVIIYRDAEKDKLSEGFGVFFMGLFLTGLTLFVFFCINNHKGNVERQEHRNEICATLPIRWQRFIDYVETHDGVLREKMIKHFSESSPERISLEQFDECFYPHGILADVAMGFIDFDIDFEKELNKE